MSKTLPSLLVDFLFELKVPLTITDPNRPDDPILGANEPFLKMVGYAPEDVVGKNCRFLQGPIPQPEVRQRIRGDLESSGNARVLVRNYRCSGEAFDNFLYVFTVKDADGKPMYRIGSQCEIPVENKADVFVSHAQELLSGIEKMKSRSGLRDQLINTADLANVTVKDLFMARIQALGLWCS